jgi:hypothetical protein
MYRSVLPLSFQRGVMLGKAASGCLVFIVLLIVSVIVIYWVGFPKVSYKYRLTVAVESDGRVHSGSSVIEVDYQFWPKALRGLVGGSSSHGSVTGQAVVIDLGARGALVAALGGLPGDYCVVSALSLVGRAYEPAVRRRRCVSGYPLSYENERALANESVSVELTRDNLPAFIWFADKADSTWRQVEPSDFPTVIGDATRLVSAQIEITHEPVVIDIDKKLPAYTELRAKSDSWRQFVSEGDK